MKQKRIEGYRPNYPKKLVTGTAIAAAAMLAIGAAGCAPRTAGVPLADPTEEELVLDGDIAIEDPTEEPALEGEPAVDENGDIFLGEDDESSYRDDGLALAGKIVVPEETENP